MLLESCRADLLAAIQGGAPRFFKPAKGPWALFLEALAGAHSRMGPGLGEAFRLAATGPAAPARPGTASTRAGLQGTIENHHCFWMAAHPPGARQLT